MAQVIYMPQKQQRRDPTAEMRGVLTRLAMMKMQHDYNMEIADSERKNKKVALEESREYDEKKTEATEQRKEERDIKDKGYIPAGEGVTDASHLTKGSYRKVGDKIFYAPPKPEEVEGRQWVKEGGEWASKTLPSPPSTAMAAYLSDPTTDKSPAAVGNYKRSLTKPPDALATSVPIKDPKGNILGYEETYESGKKRYATKPQAATPGTVSEIQIDAIADGAMEHPEITQDEARKLRATRLETTRNIAISQASGKVEGTIPAADAARKAMLVINGRESFDYFKNVFGVSVQEQIRTAILNIDPNYDFMKARVSTTGLKKSYELQEQNRGAMGSFVGNLNKQIGRVKELSEDIIKRVGARAIDLPIRELHTRFLGSGHENVLRAYMKEISAEIDKLSQGSTRSVAQLPVESRKDWERIHDVNLSMKDLLIVLNGTTEMANMRLDSVDEELERTLGMFETRLKESTSIKTNGGKTKPISEMTDEEITAELNK